MVGFYSAVQRYLYVLSRISDGAFFEKKAPLSAAYYTNIISDILISTRGCVSPQVVFSLASMARVLCDRACAMRSARLTSSGVRGKEQYASWVAAK